MGSKLVGMMEQERLSLLLQVARDVRGLLECNCTGPCEGSCTWGMAGEALDLDLELRQARGERPGGRP